MNKTFYIFRHGLATKSKNGYGAHIKSATLLPEAYPPVEKMGNYLKNISVDHFFSSEYLRCVQTSEIITKITHIPFIKDKRLNEYNTISFSDFVSQLSSFLTEIETMDTDSIILCTHVADIVVLEKLLRHETVTQEDISTNSPLPGVLHIIQNGKVEEINFNE